MRLFLLDKRKITKLTLPQIANGAYSMEYDPEYTPVKKKISIDSHLTKWILRSNGSVNVLQNNRVVVAAVLNEYEHYQLKVMGSNETLILFAMPDIEKEYYILSPTEDTITIGNTSDCAIEYNHELIHAEHVTISKQGGLWYVSCPNDDNCLAYLNQKRITKDVLKTGDIIFINGLKIIWLINFMYVYNPQDRVNFNKTILVPYNEPPVNNANYTPVTDDEMGIELYKQDDYFFHVLRIKPTITQKKIEIEPPPGNQQPESMPAILMLGQSFMMIASSFMMVSTLMNALSNGSTIKQMLPQIVMLIAMLVGSILMPTLIRAWQKNRTKKREAKRQTKYPKYLKDKIDEIDKIRDDQRQILQTNNPSLSECYGIAFSNSRSKWSREVQDEDFLSIRLGTSDLPSLIELNKIKKGFTLDDDNLFDLAVEVTNKEYKLEKVPIAFSFLQSRITALICPGNFEQDYINGLILQAITYHSALDLKLVFLLNDSNIEKWEYLKFLPHVFNDTKEIRFFADNLTEIKTVCSYLEEEFNNRKDSVSASQSKPEDKSSYKQFRSYYLIITNDYMTVKNMPFINKILNSEDNYGFSLLMCVNSTNHLPKQCNVFLQVLDTESQIIEKNQNHEVRFHAEYDNKINMRSITTQLANIPLLVEDAAAMLPNFLTFLDMYNVSKIEQLNIQNRWKLNNPVKSLQAPVGVMTSGEHFMLDLHERFHGPHGLVAGTTGSGKSEFLISYLLSLSINYHPDEVQFVIIDYKGGGLAGAFENRQTGTKIPHLVGTITNLDVSEMNRTLVSINSEMKRRQKVFNEAREALDEGTIDIYKYQSFYRQGLVKEPMSHLFIVSDEFAELKSQQPEFMDELISAARIGRSLGIHLILATQKPAGVVTDQIWSNSKFKVCLKVQDVADSMDMLKRPEAASLKDAGRFYLQVGHDEYFDIGQAGWAGAKYKPSDKIVKTIDDSINFIDNVGHIYKTINDEVKKEETEDKADQLISIVKYIIGVAERMGYEAKQLWRSIIPSEIFLYDLRIKYKYQRTAFHINPIIGEYDNPKAQFQGLLTLDITNKGNTIIYGQQGSGKENLLSTIIYSICINHHPAEVNFYIIDMGAETLGIYNKMPHVGDVCFIDDNEKIVDLLGIIEKEMARRKHLFVEYNGSYVNYCKNSGKTEPTMIICINNYEIFIEMYEKYADLLSTMYRDCNKFGIYFIITTSASSSVKSRVAELFGNKICLQMPDTMNYSELLGAPRNLIPLKIFGRGIISLDHGQYEFQTAYIHNPSEINDVIKQAAQTFKKYNYKAKAIPTIPEVVTPDILIPLMKDLSAVPIGINLETKEAYLHNFARNNANVLLTNDIESHKDFIYGLVKVITANPSMNVKVVDFMEILAPEKLNCEFSNSNFEPAFDFLNKEVMNEAYSDKTNFYIFVGISEFKNKLIGPARDAFNNMFNNLKTYTKTVFLLADNYDGYKNGLSYEPWIDRIDKRAGIWLGYGVEEQYSITFANLSREDHQIKNPDIGFASTRNARILFKKVKF